MPFERLYGGPAYDAASESARGGESVQSSSGTPHSAGTETKRKYRRHPKPDENAPERPPSAYVIFSNRIREEIKDQNLSFTQIAKLVGDRWQKLDPTGKEPYESQANAAKERYNIQLSAYKKTEAYLEYSQYLIDFKAKHGGSGAGSGPSDVKKPKLEPHDSAGSVSVRSADMMLEHLQPTYRHSRGGSVGSLNSLPPSAAPTSPSRVGQSQPLFIQTQGSSTSLPSRQLPTAPQGGSPSGIGRDVRRRGNISGVGQLSTQSSVSEGSSAPRSDSDPLIRTASLSLSTPPSSTPPVPVQDHKPSMDIGRPRFPGPPPSLPSYGSSNYSGTMPSPAASESSWRSRPGEFRGYMDISPGSMQPPVYQPPGQVSSSISLPPLTGPDRSTEFQHRTLPMPRASPTQQPGFLQTSRYPETAAAFALNTPARLGRQDSGGEGTVERSENDAATTLAGLASGTSAIPRLPPSTQSMEQHRWPPR